MTGRVYAAGLAVIAASAPLDALAQTLGRAEPALPPLWRLATGFVLCALLAVGAAFVMKRMSRTGGAPRLRLSSLIGASANRLAVLETHRLSVHADLCLVAFDQREYVLVVAQSGAIVLGEAKATPAPEDAA